MLHAAVPTVVTAAVLLAASDLLLKMLIGRDAATSDATATVTDHLLLGCWL